MQTKISTKGQVVVPNRIRRKLNLQPGDLLEAKLEGRRIVLNSTETPSANRGEESVCPAELFRTAASKQVVNGGSFVGGWM